MLLTLVLLGIVVFYSIFRAGGVTPSDSCLVATALAGVGALAVIASRNAKAPPPLSRMVKWPLILLPLYMGFQLVPLPLRLVEFASPARAGIERALAVAMPVGGFAPLSVVPATTLLHLIEAVSCVIVFLTVRRIVWRLGERPWPVVLPLVVIGVAEALTGLVQSYNPVPGKLAAGTYVNHNHFAGLLEMILPFAVLYPAQLLSRPEAGGNSGFWTVSGACFFMGAAGLMLAAILRCFSRMGLIAALIGLCVCGAGMALGAPWMQAMSGARRWTVVGAGGLLFVLAGLIFLPPDQLISRFATSDIRGEIWEESLPLVRDYWLLGCGSGGYESVFMKYKRTDPMHRVDYAHNDYLQRLVELGVPGTVLAASLIFGMLAHPIRLAQRRPVWSARALAVACIAAITAILFHSLVDFNLYIPANALVLAWLGGVAVSIRFSSRPVRSVFAYGGGRIVDVPSL